MAQEPKAKPGGQAPQPVAGSDLEKARAPAETAASAAVGTIVKPPPLPSPAVPEPRRRPAISAPPAPDEQRAETPERRVARRRPAGPSRNRIAANDDAPSIGGLIYALNQKPSKRPFVWAAGASGVWAALGLGFAWAFVAPELMNAGGFGDVVGKTALLSALATICGPIALLWFLALLAWRTEELKLRSSAMTEVAVRLAEPDRMAEQSVASLGQSVRRQVSFMNDAVARALGRAGELEALVHSEVTALERSYEDNERKIRGLIQELVGERSALLNTSERVADTLRGLGNEVPVLIDKLAAQQTTLSGLIEGAGHNLNALESGLGSRTQHLQSVLEDYTAALGTALGTRTEQMQVMFDGYRQSIDSSIADRTQDLQIVLEEYNRALDATLANRAQALDMQLVERTRALDDAFSERLRLFDESILRSTMAIDGAVSEKALLLTSAMDQHARTLNETIGKQATDLDETLMQGITAVRLTSENITRQSVKAIEGLAGQSDLLKSVSENLLTQVNSVTNRFENQGQVIMKAANALETANYRIDATLQNRHAELAGTLDRLSGRADDLGRVMQGYSSTIEGSLTEAERRARLLTQELAKGAEAHSRSTLAEIERLKHEASSETERAMDDLRTKFSTVSQEMTQQLGSLTAQVTSSSSEMRESAARAAAQLESEQARIRSQLENLPAATRESADAMRRALQDQLRALEQLSTLTTRVAARRDVASPLDAGGHGGAPARDGRSRALSTLSSSLAQELGARARQSQVPAIAPPQHGHAPPPGDGRENWSLGDLLARASRDEDGATGGHGRGQVPAMNLNLEVIARALDPNTASAIWSRFRSGQRGIMVRSIYSADGRVVFDEVSRRYRSEPEFESTINRFMMEFERILRDAEQRDPSGRTTHGQLVSDSGRVYLFLAHASGRLA